MNMMMMSNQSNNRIFNTGSELPLLEIKDLGSGIEVMLISGLNKNFMLYEVISVLEEEGAEVVAANFSTVADKIFYTFHAQVRWHFHIYVCMYDSQNQKKDIYFVLINKWLVMRVDVGES